MNKPDYYPCESCKTLTTRINYEFELPSCCKFCDVMLTKENAKDDNE
jgi:hypothetical protein